MERCLLGMKQTLQSHKLKAVSVHRQDCPSTVSYGWRKALWDLNLSPEPFVTLSSVSIYGFVI